MIRRIALLALAVAALALPASAVAASPAVTIDAASLKQAKPVFTWTNTPEEYVDVLTTSNKATVDAAGVLSVPFTYLTPLGTLTTVDTERTHWAGTNYWQVRNVTAATAQFAWSAPVAFQVPASGFFSGLGIQQDRRSPQLTIQGKAVINAPKAKMLCSVKRGRSTVDTESDSVTTTIPGVGQRVGCRLGVPEELDGVSLTAIARLVIGTKVVRTDTKAFVAK